MCGATPTAGCAGISDYLTDTVTVATHLLDHKRPLSDGLKALTSTATAGRGRRARLRLATLAGNADIGAPEVDNFLGAIHCVHKFYFEVEHNVLAFTLCLLLAATLLSTKHLLELVENVTKGLTLASLSPLKLVREAYKTGESLTTAKWIASEGALTTEWILSLLVARHTGLIIDTSLSFITKRLIRVVNRGKLLLSLLTRVDIRMVLLGELEVSLLHIRLRCISVDI